MKRLLLAMALVACTKVEPPLPAPVIAPQEQYRNRSVPIGSALKFSAKRFAGSWVTVAGFPEPATSGCTRIVTDYATQPDGRLSVSAACRTRDGNLQPPTLGHAEIVGPGRMKVSFDSAPETEDNWVLWVDEGYRTAVIGTPDGHFGRILNRDAAIPADRMRAARDVLDFNGYDLGRLIEVAR